MAKFANTPERMVRSGPVTCLSLATWLCISLSGCGMNSSPAPVDSWQSRKMTGNRLQADTYQVKSGDTLFSIAFRNGMDYRSLARLNRIAEPYTIYVGQLLVVSNNSTETGNGRNPVATSLKSNKNYSNSNSSDTASKSAKVVAPQNQKRYGQNERVAEPEKTENSTINGNVRQWHWPVKGPILAKFSSQEHGNKGLDIGGAFGTPVKAAAAGQVVYAGNALRGYGNLIIIKHNDDFLSAYAHNHRLLVKERESVAAGQTIAEMGNSDADRIQLHFEIRYRGKSVDPLRYLK